MASAFIICIILLGFCYEVLGMINDSGEIVLQEYLRWNYTHMNPSCTGPGGGRNPCKDIRICNFAVASLAIGGWPTLCGWVGKGVPKVCCGLPLVLGPSLMKKVDEEKARKKKCGTTISEYLSETEDTFLQILKSLPKVDISDPKKFDPPLDLHIEPMTSSTWYEGSKQGRFPWMVSIRKDGFHICGGSLLDRRHILTAAHCFENINDQNTIQYTVHVGNLFVDDGVPFNITNIIIHPKYESGKIHKNLAILTLSNEILSPMIPHICLSDPYIGSNNLLGRNSTLLRWGKITKDNESKIILHIIDNQTVIPTDDCYRHFRTYGKVVIPDDLIDDFICTEARKQTKNECEEDYGGPLMYKNDPANQNEYSVSIPWLLVGVDTFGPMCAEEKSPGLYTKVSSHLDWILEIINNGLELDGLN